MISEAEIFIPEMFLSKKEYLALKNLAEAIESSVNWKKKFPHEQTYLRLSLQFVGGNVKRLQSEGLFLERYEKAVYSVKRDAVSLLGKASMCVQFMAAQEDAHASILKLIDQAVADGWENNKNLPLLFCSVFDYAHIQLAKQPSNSADSIFEHLGSILRQRADKER